MITEVPLCPVTGTPAVRHIQSISTAFLKELWRITFNTNANTSFQNVNKIDLWESETGLYFFHPIIEGDQDFYEKLYAWFYKRKLLQKGDGGVNNIKPYLKYIENNAKLLDVGCGIGALQSIIKNVKYTGIDPYVSTSLIKDGIFKQTLQEHLKTYKNYYDVACALEVLEHVSNPKEMFMDIVRAVKPGGLIIISVPSVKSVMTEIPNFIMNAPPHHLTWWTKNTFQYLAKENNLKIELLEQNKIYGSVQLIYWMAKCSICKNGKYYFKHSWFLHASTILAFICGKFMNVCLGKFTTDKTGLSLILIARKL